MTEYPSALFMAGNVQGGMILFSAEIHEPRVLTLKGQVKDSRAAVPVFCDSDVGFAVLEVVVLVLGVIILPEHEKHQIRVLLNSP